MRHSCPHQLIAVSSAGGHVAGPYQVINGRRADAVHQLHGQFDGEYEDEEGRHFDVGVPKVGERTEVLLKIVSRCWRCPSLIRQADCCWTASLSRPAV